MYAGAGRGEAVRSSVGSSRGEGEDITPGRVDVLLYRPETSTMIG